MYYTGMATILSIPAKTSYQTDCTADVAAILATATGAQLEHELAIKQRQGVVVRTWLSALDVEQVRLASQTVGVPLYGICVL